MVLLACCGLGFGLGDVFTDFASNRRWGDQQALALFIGLFALLHVPLDALGGWLLPRAFQRSTAEPASFLSHWIHGVLIHAAATFAGGMGLLWCLRWGGWPAAIAFLLLSMLFMLLVQARLSAWILGKPRLGNEGSPSILHPPEVLVRQGIEEGFAGGIVGFPGREQFVVPQRWVQEWPPSQVELTLARRRHAVQSGLYARGLLMALAWNLTGSILAAIFLGAPQGTVGEVISFSLLVTLWSFFGLLVLPTASRNAVLEIDQAMLQQGFSRADLSKLAMDCARLQEGEASRNPWLERIFHPIPSLQNRSTSRDERARHFAGWNASRQMLFLSWPLMGLVARAVHGNVGRPSFWVLPPAD